MLHGNSEYIQKHKAVTPDPNRNPVGPIDLRAVFLSYASEDATAAERICTSLRAAGIEVWFDRNALRGGDAWDATIRQQIKMCALFIPVISNKTQARGEGYFRLEWKLAVDRSHLMSTDQAFLVPVVIDDTNDALARVPDRFREVQWTRLSDGITPVAFADHIARLLSPPSPRRTPASPPPSIKDRPAPGAKLRRAVGFVAAGVLLIAAITLAVEKWLVGRLPASGSALPSISDAPFSRSRANWIAVLPFTDMSEKKDQDYFSDGLAETLLELLAKTPELHVIARSSSFAFKGKSDDLATIGKKLNVANLLQGSVRKSGNHLRVTTALIRADDGEELWSQSYDQEFADIFKMQDEISAAVVAALKLKIAPTRHSTVRGTENLEAYTQYLLGRQFYQRGNLESDRLALAAFQRSIELDPRYAAAYAELGLTEHYLGAEADDASAYEKAYAAVDKAIALAPMEAGGYAARAQLRWLQKWDAQGARADYESALTLDPGDGRNYVRYGLVLATLGEFPRAIAASKRSIELDPLSTVPWSTLVRIYLTTRDFAAAEAATRQLQGLQLDPQRTLLILATLQLLEGHAADALKTYSAVEQTPYRLCGFAIAQFSAGSSEDSRAALDELQLKFAAHFAYQIAQAHAWRGEPDLAFEWLDKAYSQRDGGLSFITYDPLLNALRGDPRYKAFMRKMRLPLG
jgi:TolB-like protein/Tfp pilus assembly protein PilF